jgi:hypothetical protein
LKCNRAPATGLHNSRFGRKITEEFWEAQSAEWQQEEQTLLVSLRELEQTGNPERVLDRVRILELANKAQSPYPTQTPTEKAKLLPMVLSNCAVGAVSVYPTYRKPFDMIFKRAKNEGMVDPERLELPTPAFEAQCSIQLSYGSRFEQK